MEKSTLESTQEVIDLWLKTYEATFGRLVEMPAMGPAREKSERLMKGASNLVNLHAAWTDSNSNLLGVLMEAMRKMHEKASAEIGGEITPEKYKDFYRLWIETFSATFKEFFNSGHFASDIGKFTSHLMEFQKYNRDMLEENCLKPMNLPTKTEIDEINKEIYLLKKSVKELTGKIKELSEKK
ncbi:MAG: poly(R)-hydroxyalkanoic acid synthase subunit PhaE [Nitrospirota bacterium]